MYKIVNLQCTSGDTTWPQGSTVPFSLSCQDVLLTKHVSPPEALGGHKAWVWAGVERVVLGVAYCPPSSSLGSNIKDSVSALLQLLLLKNSKKGHIKKYPEVPKSVLKSFTFFKVFFPNHIFCYNLNFLLNLTSSSISDSTLQKVHCHSPPTSLLSFCFVKQL